jgi:RNA polymerase sigma factor (sigma-70 family)
MVLGTIKMGVRDHNLQTTAGPASDESGDPSRREHLAELIQKHNESLVRFLEAKLRSREDAREVAQEAYVRFLGLDESTVVSSQRSYLYRIAANLAIDKLRERQHHQRDQHLIDFDSGQETPTPEGIYIAKQERDRLERAVAALPANCRMAFILVEFQGKSFAAAAAQMNAPAATVRQWVHRAYGYLAKKLADPAEGPDSPSNRKPT